MEARDFIDQGPRFVGLIVLILLSGYVALNEQSNPLEMFDVALTVMALATSFSLPRHLTPGAVSVFAANVPFESVNAYMAPSAQAMGSATPDNFVLG